MYKDYNIGRFCNNDFVEEDESDTGLTVLVLISTVTGYDKTDDDYPIVIKRLLGLPNNYAKLNMSYVGFSHIKFTIPKTPNV